MATDGIFPKLEELQPMSDEMDVSIAPSEGVESPPPPPLQFSTSPPTGEHVKKPMRCRSPHLLFPTVQCESSNLLAKYQTTPPAKRNNTGDGKRCKRCISLPQPYREMNGKYQRYHIAVILTCSIYI